MKNYSLLLLLILFFNNNLSAQDYKKELLKSYTTQELNGFTKSKITILEYALENSCYFTPLPEGKTMDFPEIEVKKQVANFTDFGLKIEDFTQYFIVKNQNKLLVVKSSYILDLEIKNKKK
jgi:hypothetical protein